MLCVHAKTRKLNACQTPHPNPIHLLFPRTPQIVWGLQNPKLAFWALGRGLAKSQKAHFRELGGLETGQKKQITNLIFGFATLSPSHPKRPTKQFGGVEGLGFWLKI